MATTRLRRTFRYPTDSDSDDLDEEHQEALLATLQTQDEAASSLYRHLFLALPVLTSLTHIPTLLTARSALSVYLALLNVFVPAQGAYVLYFCPIRVPGRHGLRSLYFHSERSEEPGGVKPRERHLIVLGASLAVMLGLQAASTWWGGKGEGDWRDFVPSVVYFLTLFVRQQLAPVDLDELQRARYELKGA